MRARARFRVRVKMSTNCTFVWFKEVSSGLDAVCVTLASFGSVVCVSGVCAVLAVLSETPTA